MIKINKAIILKFCEIYKIDLINDGLFIRAFSDEDKDAKAVSFYHVDTMASWKKLQQLTTDRYGLHTPINLFSSNIIRKGECEGVRAFVVDFDNCDDYETVLKDFPIAPTLVTNREGSSRGHAHWIFENPLPVGAYPWSNIQERLAIELGAEPSDMKSEATLCRLPGSGHFKDGKSAKIVITNREAPVYQGIEISEYFNESLKPLIKKKNPALSVATKALSLQEEERIKRYKSWLGGKTPPVNDGMDNYIYSLAAKASSYGITIEEMTPLIERHVETSPRFKDADLEKKEKYLTTTIENGFNYAQEGFGGADLAPISLVIDEEVAKQLRRDKKGRLTKQLANVRAIVRHLPFFKGLYALNTFTNRIEVTRDTSMLYERDTTGPELTDGDERAMRIFLSESLNYEAKKEDTFTSIYSAAQEHQYNPVQDYLNSVKWDGKPRLDGWLAEYCRVPKNNYSDWAGTAFLVAAVARAFEPGIKYDYLLVLEGEEGWYKSSALAVIGGKYHIETAFSKRNQDKDYFMMLDNNWVIELGELANIQKVDQEGLKLFISKQFEDYRSPYDRVPKRHYRSYIFAGTTNRSHYLGASNGNRRFMPVRLQGAIKINQLKEDRDQLFAEAVKFYREGFKLGMPKAIEDFARREQDLRRMPNDWEDALAEFVLKHGEGAWSYEELWQQALKMNSEIDHTLKSRLGKVVAEIGGVYGRARLSSGTRRVAWSFSQDAVDRLRSRKSI